MKTMYIIHDTPYNTNYYIWKRHYLEHLKNVFYNINKVVDVNSQIIFDNFCLFLYNNSSKYLDSNI